MPAVRRLSPARVAWSDCEARFSVEEAGTFSGYAAVFGAPDAFGDTIKAGAFAKSLREHAARKTAPGLFWMHDPAEPIGRWTALAEDEKGLKVTGQLVLETTRGREAHALLKAGALNGLSIGFRARQSERGPNGNRVLTDIDLVEISLVSLPAALRARVTSVKSSPGAAPGLAAFLTACAAARRSLTRR